MVFAGFRLTLGDKISHPHRITPGIGEAGIQAVGTEVLQQLLRHLAEQ
jgi:hypothetical protein